MLGTRWQTSDPDPEARASIAAWIAHEGLANVLPPLAIDVRSEDWGVGEAFDAIVAINMIHIAPWEATAGFSRCGVAVEAGWYRVSLWPVHARRQTHRAVQRNVRQWLKQRDPDFGVRDLDDVTRVAER